MPETIVKVGPNDHGRRMSLAEFDHAEGQEGHLYELNRGVVVVSDVPSRPHAAQVDEVRQQLAAYRVQHPEQIHFLAGGAESKILLRQEESERHPDVSVYKRPPDSDDDLWATWIPEIVVEIISPGSGQRDYVEKREEYLLYGVREY